MSDPNMRRRVLRLLEGDFRADDLTRLFLYARDRCDGRESVQEIGDFVAHHDERYKGIVTRYVREWFAIVRFMAPRLAQKEKAIDISKLPPTTPDFLRAQVRRIGNALLKQRTSLTRPAARKHVDRILRQLQMNDDGTFQCNRRLRNKEIDVLQCLCSMLVVEPAFECSRLVRDFTATLRSNGLLRKTEAKAFEQLEATIGLFAISVMHNCVIRLQDKTTMKLIAKASDSGVSLMAPVPMEDDGKGSTIKMSFDLFRVEGPQALHCDRDLIAKPDWEDIPLEVSAQLKLTRI